MTESEPLENLTPVDSAPVPDPVLPSEDAATNTDEFQRLDLRQITVSRIVGFIVTGVISCGILVGLVVALFPIGFNWIWGMLAGAGLLFILFLLWISFVWPVWEHEKTSWRLGDNGLEIHRGVYWQHRISIPVARVQHADVTQGPLQRRYELGKLTIHTAGTQNASVELEGISHATAIALRDQIVNQRKSANVV